MKVTKTEEPRVLLHISGPDRPGVTSALTRILSETQSELVDIGQSVLHGYLSLSAIVSLRPNSDALGRVLLKTSELGLRLDVNQVTSDEVQNNSSTDSKNALCVTLLGELQNGLAVAAATELMATCQMNIRDIKTLSDGKLAGIEFIVDPPKNSKVDTLRELREKFLNLARTLKVDIALQHDDIFRTNRRLLCLDVDSTFIKMEVIDELARLAGRFDEVAKITTRAMEGKLDFEEALRERVALLKGLPMEKAKTLLKNIPLTSGAKDLVQVLKNLGFKVGLVSGGFDFVTDHLKALFNLDFAFANKLEIEDGVLTGKVTGNIVDAKRKGQVLLDMAHAYSLRLEQTVAVGDGANDMVMLKSAGLGIAYRAKPKLQEVADLSINANFLNSLLFLMGFKSQAFSSFDK